MEEAMHWFLLILAGIFVIFAAILALTPSHFKIERSALIAAPAASVFQHINDFHLWQAWSPWAKLDPMAVSSFLGAPAGEGAVYTWAGNKKIGEGRMTIIESKPVESVGINLEFIRPFPNTNNVRFTLHPEQQQTRVTWTMTGNHKLMPKAFCLFMNMDKMVGGDFERGLASMKAAVEHESMPA